MSTEKNSRIEQDQIDDIEIRRKHGHRLPSTETKALERCIHCDDPTGRAGATDDSLYDLLGELLEAAEEMLTIVRESHGVYGFHLNGDGAEWGEFEAVVQLEAAIAKAEGKA